MAFAASRSNRSTDGSEPRQRIQSVVVADRALTMAPGSQRLPLTAERIERALVLLAYFIELDGDVHVPLYERLEAELQRLRRMEDTRARARRLLAAYSDGAVKAISSKNLSFNPNNVSTA